MVIFNIMQVTTIKGTFLLREALASDLPALVSIHVSSWNATYPKHFPKPTYPFREQQWKKAFKEKANNWTCFIAQNKSGRIAGFITSHDFADEELPYKGQLDKIHILKAYQRLGIGRMLVSAIVHGFLQRGIDSMILFADPDNPAIRFYEKLGGEKVLNKKGKFEGAFGWENIRVLQDPDKEPSK